MELSKYGASPERQPKPWVDYHILSAYGDADARESPEQVPGSSISTSQKNDNGRTVQAFRRARPSLLSILTDVAAVATPVAFIVICFII